MEAHPFGDLHQAHDMEDSRYPFWMTDQDSYIQPYRQQEMPFLMDEDTYLDDFSNGSTNAPPMQRFMTDSYPLTDGMLHANIPLNGQYKWQPEQQWFPADCFRHPSPDRTSSSNTSQNTQDELSSPYTYHVSPYVSPMDYSQMSYSFPPTEQFQGISYQFEASVLPGNCSLSELEYTPAVPKTENDDVTVKQETIPDSPHRAVKKEETPEPMVYSDSGIGNSTRDAQSVEPVDFSQESTSDSEYSPSPCRSGKRRRSTASGTGPGHSLKRRKHARKDSYASSPTVCTKVDKKARRSSKSSVNRNTEAAHQADCRRRFPCPFGIYGCKSEFSSKNEWKRHISTQHIKLSYWRCDLCPPSVDPSDEDSFYHNDFNRKDLFTQHLRRMHAATKDKSPHSHKEYPVTEDNLAEHQARCSHRLRNPPPLSSCLFCPRSFEGVNSWDERIEHVGRHLEKDYATRPGMLDPTTWNVDERLERYLVDEGLIASDGYGWRIGDGNPCRGTAMVDGEDDE
ncbi:hypothetical protein ACJQWK_05854 [Exserohilum turcicum]